MTRRQRKPATRGRGEPPCQACGTWTPLRTPATGWTCADCGWQRHGANLGVFQDCLRCGGGSNEGSAFRRTRHYKPWTWQDHNPAAGPLCEKMATMFGYLCSHPSCRTIAWRQ